MVKDLLLRAAILVLTVLFLSNFSYLTAEGFAHTIIGDADSDNDYYLNNEGMVLISSLDNIISCYDPVEGQQSIHGIPGISTEVLAFNNCGAFTGTYCLDEEQSCGSFIYYPEWGFIDLNQKAKAFELIGLLPYLINDQGLVVGFVTIFKGDGGANHIFTYHPEQGFNILEEVDSFDGEELLLNLKGQILLKNREGYALFEANKGYTALEDFGLKKAITSKYKEIDSKDFRLDNIRIITMNDNGLVLGRIYVSHYTSSSALEEDSFIYFVYSLGSGVQIIPINAEKDALVALNNNNQVVITGEKIAENKLVYEKEHPFFPKTDDSGQYIDDEFSYYKNFYTYTWSKSEGLKPIISWMDHIYAFFNKIRADEAARLNDVRLHQIGMVFKESGELFLAAQIGTDEDFPDTIIWDTKHGMRCLSDCADILRTGEIKVPHARWMYENDPIQINSRGEILIPSTESQDHRYSVLFSPLTE